MWCAACAAHSARIAVRPAEACGLRPGVEMRHERCTVTARLAGPCARCRQAAWPSHVWPDGRILCGNCCPCAPRDATPGRDAAGHAHDAGPVMPREAGPGHDALAAHREPPKNKPRIGLPAGAVALERGGKARSVVVGEYYPAGSAHFWGRFWPCAGHPARRPAQRYRRCRPGRDLAAPHSLPCRPPRCRPPWPAPPGNTEQPSLRRAVRGKTFPCPNVSGKILWRVNNDRD
jgi:hypothetical protein